MSPRAVRQRIEAEDGLALVFALFAVLVLTGLITLLVSRSINESRFSGVSRDFETAVHVAEAGADELIRQLNDEDLAVGPVITVNPATSSDHIVDVSVINDDDLLREWAIARALEAGATGDLVDTDEGQAFSIRAWVEQDDDGACTGPLPPTPGGECFAAPFILGVGFVPSYDADNRRVRVVKLRTARQVTSPRYALLTGGDLNFGGNAAILAPGCDTSTPETTELTCIADIQVNGDVSVSGSSHSIEGRLSVTGSISGSPVTANGSAGGAQPADVPAIAAADLRERPSSQFNQQLPLASPPQPVEFYDLCPNGEVRFRDDRPTPSDSGTIVPVCTGTIAGSGGGTGFRGWRWRPSQKEWDGGSVDNGIYYVHYADASVNGSASSPLGPRAVTVLVAEDPTDRANTGSLSISGNPKMAAGLSQFQFVADNDIDMNGSSSGGGAGFSGLIYAGELLKMQGTVALAGAMMEAGKCDGNSPATGYTDHHGLVTCNTHGVGGTLTLDYDSSLKLDLAGIVTIEYWNEL